MFSNPNLMLTLANDRHRQLVAEAERSHLLTIARAARRSRRARQAQEMRGRPAGTLAPCEPSAAVPAR
jgi:hypothetical protein